MKLGCQLPGCGYRKCPRALHWHHLDPSKKKFEMNKGHTHAWPGIRREIRKCAVLCANHHAELDAGFIQLPEGISARILFEPDTGTD